MPERIGSIPRKTALDLVRMNSRQHRTESHRLSQAGKQNFVFDHNVLDHNVFERLPTPRSTDVSCLWEIHRGYNQQGGVVIISEFSGIQLPPEDYPFVKETGDYGDGSYVFSNDSVRVDGQWRILIIAIRPKKVTQGNCLLIQVKLVSHRKQVLPELLDRGPYLFKAEHFLTQPTVINPETIEISHRNRFVVVSLNPNNKS